MCSYDSHDVFFVPPPPADEEGATSGTEIAPISPEVDALNLEGQELMQRAKYADAVLKFEEALKLDPTRPGLWLATPSIFHRKQTFMQCVHTFVFDDQLPPFHFVSNMVPCALFEQ
jgi:hypothetical protein